MHNSDFDFLMKSILENGQEEVPARVWDGISERLDAAERRRKTVLWWRRAVSWSAVAAVLALGAFFGFRETGKPVHEEIMVASAPSSETVSSPEAIAEAKIPVSGLQEEIQSYVPRSAAGLDRHSAGCGTYPDAEDAGKITGTADFADTGITEADIAEAYIAETESREDTAANKDAGRDAAETSAYHPDRIQPADRIEDSWKETPEDGDFKEGGINTSIVISGITGTNSTRNKERQNLMKRPTVPSAMPKTGITETSTNTTYGIPVSFGAGVKIELTKRWAVGAGINYTLLTRKFYGTYTKATPEGEIEISQSSDIRNVQHYIGIPVNAYFNIIDNRHLNFYAYAGGAVEKCISDRYEVLGITGSAPVIHKEKAKGIQLSANLGIGVEFMLGEHVGLYVDPSLRYYFANGQPKSIRTAQPLMLGFEMGIRARL